MKSMKKKKRRLTKFGKFVVVLFSACIVLLLVWSFRMLFIKNDNQVQATAEVSEVPTATPVSTPTPTPVDTAFEAEYQANKQVNNEYIGKMTFESGIISQNIVQTTDNEKYLSTSWDNTSNNEGAVYLDYRNQLSDQNLIFYGHYVYYDASKMFTPLSQLLDQGNYETNKYFDIAFSGTDKRRYIITDVFYFPLDSETLQYYLTSYDQATFDAYYAAVKQADFYQTGQTLTMSDHWVSLQTCVRNHDELREIVLAKEIKQ